MLSRGAVESLPEFVWRIVKKLPEFNLFSDKSARILLIFPSICPNLHGFQKKIFGGGQLPPPPLSRTPMEINDGNLV
jgi:hypothetical protein